jgi:cell division protein FtsW
LWRIFRLAIRAASLERFFEAYLAVGIGTWLGLQAVINLGVNMGMLPTKGLTLPLVSYGRSSLIIAMISLGILFRIHHELATDAKPPTRRRRSRKSSGARR